jgi:geranylgeranyl reductase family protein
VERADVVIVGGGPAGSTLAWLLGRRGVDVVVADRERFPRAKPCAGWITPAVVRDLELDLADYAAGHVLQPIHGFRVGLIGGRETQTRRSPRPVSYGILRREFDAYLLRRSGARLRMGRPVRELRRDNGEWVVDGAIRSPLVVGAGGHFCPVARRLGARSGRERIVLAQETEFELDAAWLRECKVDPEMPELMFCGDLKGYGWVFRKGPYLNIGLGREDRSGLANDAREFVADRCSARAIPGTAVRGLRGHAYALYRGGRRPVSGDGVLLVGDAAGLADRRSGEGIGPAVLSAILAAETIGSAGGGYDRERLARYDRSLSRRFGPRRPRAELSGLIPAWIKTLLARRLLATEPFARRVVCERWFLHAAG